MSFSLKKASMFLCTLLILLLSSTGAYAAFPDLGVVGDHRLMTVVGFAQQDYYFDLFKIGGLQTLALTFALIGGLLILLIPKNHNFITIGCYLLLVFILIVSPDPDEESFFFFPLGDHADKWNCPVPPNDTGLSMEVFCKNGIDSVAGKISDTLSAYTGSTRNETHTGGFGAFTPQLVTIHFFTAVERTLLEALWENTENITHPGDLLGVVDGSNLAADAVNSNANIQYYNAVYSHPKICGSHSDLLTVGNFLKLAPNEARSAAETTFTFEDAIIANNIYYAGEFDQQRAYPIRAATAQLNNKDYAKSLNFDGTDKDEAGVSKQSIADGLINSIDVSMEVLALENYKRERQGKTDSRLGFPHSGNTPGKTNIFRTLLEDDDDYNISGTLNLREYAREPDPYDYDLGGLDTHDPKGTRKAYDDNSLFWRNADFHLQDIPPVSEQEFDASIRDYDKALKDLNDPQNGLAIMMKAYPVQFYVPYVEPDGGVRLGAVSKGLLPRTYDSKEDLGGVAQVSVSASKFTPAVQSCLDFAALIWSRKFYALEEVPGLLPSLAATPSVPLDLRQPLNVAAMQAIVEIPDDANPAHMQIKSSLGEQARIGLLKAGCAKNDAGDWTGCSDSAEALAAAAGVPEAMCKIAAWSCRVKIGISGLAADVKNSIKAASGDGFASVTASPAGATSYGGFNSVSAGVGDFLVKYGLMIASVVQGFVYGAYMKLIPVIISYGIAITLFMTPFVFLMGIAIPMQARSVLIAPIVAIAFLKTVSIALVMVDHAFVSLMFWVERVNVSDPQLYKAMLIMAHLTASVSLFSLAGLLLFGLNDPGAFVKHLASMDKAGQVSFQEAMAYGAAPIAAAGMAKRGIEKTASMARVPFKAANEKIGQTQARKLEAGGGATSDQLDEIARVSHSTGIAGAVHSLTGAKTRAAGLVSEMGRMGEQEGLRDKLGDRYTAEGKAIAAMDKEKKQQEASLKASAMGQDIHEQDMKLNALNQEEKHASNEVALSEPANELRSLKRDSAESELSEKLIAARSAAEQAPLRKLQAEQARYDRSKGATKSALTGIADKDNAWKSKKGGPNTSGASHELAGAVPEMGSQFSGFANRNDLDYNKVNIQLVEAFNEASASMSEADKKEIFKQDNSLNERHGFTAVRKDFIEKMADKAFASDNAAEAKANKDAFMEAMKKKLQGDYVIMDETTGSKAEVTKLLKKHGIK